MARRGLKARYGFEELGASGGLKKLYMPRNHMLHCMALLLIWVVVKIMVPCLVLSIIRHLAFRGPKRGP